MSKGRRASERRKNQQPGKDISEALSETLTGRNTLDLGDLDDVTIGTVGHRDIASQMEQEGRPRANPNEHSATRAFAKAVAEGTGGPESTKVLPPPDKPARDGGRLTLISGGNAGARLDLVRSPFIVGRQKGLDLTLDDDKKVSRVHFRLVFENRRRTWFVEDLDSSSGMLLNGLFLDDKTILCHGDILTFGETELRFSTIEDLPVVEDATIIPIPIGKFPPVEEARPERSMAMALAPFKEFTKAALRAPSDGEGNKKRLALIALLLLFFLFVGVAGIVTAIYILPRGPDAATLQKVEALLDEGEKALKALQLKSARGKIEKALSLVPDHKRGLSLEKLLLSEEQSKAALNDARASFKNGELDEAESFLSRIPDSSGFQKRRDALLKKIQAERIKLELDAIETLIEDGAYDEAENKLENFLKRHPENKRALALLERIQRRRNQKSLPPEGVLRAQAAFAVGNVEQAQVMARVDADRGQSAAQKYLAKLATFQREKKAAEKAMEKKRGTQALPSFEAAYRLVPYLSGRRKNAVYKRKVGNHLADALFLAAMANQGAGKKCNAATQLHRAAKIAPKNRKVKQQVLRLKTTAQNALRRATSFEESRPDRAKSMAKEAMCLVPSSSKLHKKLKRLSR
ncbi:MAG: FHA domain-containing protein [Deltaproteobacteria bacterium]|nr:FHA domain-containing protein [Deltaproteobacteria bacterium]